MDVASTKAFIIQMAALFLLTSGPVAGQRSFERRRRSSRPEADASPAISHFRRVGAEPQITAWADDIVRKDNSLFLGRGMHYSIALEGALKFKEISHIHAEAYPGGELKHGPLALMTDEMPVVTLAPNDALEELKSNMQ